MDFLAELRQSEDFYKILIKIATDPKSRKLPALLKLLAAYDDDKPVPKKEVSGRTEVTVRFEHEHRKITSG